MAAGDVGDAADFLNGPIKDFPHSVTHTPQTNTPDNISGDPVLTAGTPVAIIVVFENDDVFYSLTASGLQKGADARMFVKSTDTVAKYDQITYNGVIYEIENVSPRYDGGGDIAYSTVLLYRL